MAGAEIIRQNVRDAFGPFMTGGDHELAERLYHPDYVNHEAEDERSSGPRGAVATAEWLRSCFGDVSYEIERIIVEDDMAAVYITMSGTHEGGLPPGAPATHKPFAVKHVQRIATLGAFPPEKALALEHCILAHHGPEALPGRRFASAEALALHRLNALDASVKGALEHGLG